MPFLCLKLARAEGSEEAYSIVLRCCRRHSLSSSTLSDNISSDTTKANWAKISPVASLGLGIESLYIGCYVNYSFHILIMGKYLLPSNCRYFDKTYIVSRALFLLIAMKKWKNLKIITPETISSMRLRLSVEIFIIFAFIVYLKSGELWSSWAFWCPGHQHLQHFD